MPVSLVNIQYRKDQPATVLIKQHAQKKNQATYLCKLQFSVQHKQ